jgi:hypothetical protein
VSLARPSTPFHPETEEADPITAPAMPGRRLAYLLVFCGLVVLPWTLVLAAMLPATATAPRWPAVWAGLDAMEGLFLIATGVLSLRNDHRRSLPAAVTATLLLVDAWFDTMTSSTGEGLAEAAAMALFAELPLALVCALIARRGLHDALSAPLSEPQNIAVSLHH